ncbi:GMC family oxidoreductase [Streptomyces sp. NPDC057137]|uniref:GMC family oxidoreductase n=1 Tax=Streptomyces sp. NPDC057137 TaxID=3346030 RepID=UPI00363C8CDB
MTVESDYDYVVVGAGSAGCVIASRLSENGSSRVLLLEAGPAQGPDIMGVPPAWFGLLGSDVDWKYTTVPQKGTNNVEHFWPRGKVLGGSSSINAMAFLRGDRHSYDAWEESGASGWTYADMLPFFKRSETTQGRDPALRGTSGPLKVAPAKNRNPLAEALFDAVVETGYPSTEDLSGESPEGAGWYDLNIVEGVRQSAADAYLLPHLDRPNLTVVTDALAHRLTFEDDRCTGVEYEVEGVMLRARGLQEVVLTAGVIGSAQLLLLSGIGPSSHLNDVGIETVVDLPGVGENLQNHIEVPIMYKASRPIPQGKNNHGEMMGLLRSSPGSAHPDMLIFAIDMPFAPGVEELPEQGYSIMTVLARPHSRGTLRLASSDPAQHPVLDPQYLTDERDLETLLAALRVSRSIGEAPALAPWRETELFPGPDVQGDDELRDHIRSTTVTEWHAAGTCRMGTDDLSVVDPELRVRGLRGLRVADASVIPVLPAVNINASVIAIAERAASLIGQSV